MLSIRATHCIRKASKLQTFVLGLLVTCLMLSTCAVRKSIEVLLQGSPNTEFNMGNGSNKIRGVTAMHITNPQLCSGREEALLKKVDLQAPREVISLLAPTLFLTTLLGLICGVLLALFHARPLAVYSKASLAFNSAPIYIKNRLLLI